MDRVPDFESDGWEFESLRGHFYFKWDLIFSEGVFSAPCFLLPVTCCACQTGWEFESLEIHFLCLFPVSFFPFPFIDFESPQGGPCQTGWEFESLRGHFLCPLPASCYLLPVFPVTCFSCYLLPVTCLDNAFLW